MKVTCLPEKLSAAFAVARRAINEKSIHGVLAHVLLTTSDEDGGRLTLSGTDLRVYAAAGCPAKVETAGSATLAPKSLADFLAVCPNGEPITIAVSDKHRATLTCGRARATLTGLDPENAPPAPAMTVLDAVSLPAATLRLLIESTVFAAAPDESRPVLSGVLVMTKGGVLTLAAADGLRLAVRSETLAPGTPDITAIVPAKPLAVIANALSTGGDLVTIGVSDAHIRIESSAGLWIVTLIEGQFPDFNRIIPRETKTIVTCRRNELQRAVDLARSFEETSDTEGSRRTYRTVIARLSIVDDVLTVRSRDEHGGQEGVSEITATLEGDATQVGFNGAYLRDAIKALSGDEITLEWSGSSMPGIVREAGARNGHLQVLMAMRLTGAS